MLETIWGIFLDLLLHPMSLLSNFTLTKVPNNWSTGKNGDVILVQGFGGTWSYLVRIGNFVNKLGYKVHVLQKLGNNIAKIEKCSKILEEYLIENEIKNATIICHSKGGIIAKYFLTTSKYRDRVSKVTSISSPFKGTYLGYLNLFNVSEMAPSSKIIKNLEQQRLVNKKFINLYSKVDEIVIPNENLVLEGTRNVKIDVVGHIRILDSEKTLNVIEKILSL